MCSVWIFPTIPRRPGGKSHSDSTNGGLPFSNALEARLLLGVKVDGEWAVDDLTGRNSRE